jgi:hypothetical protein
VIIKQWYDFTRLTHAKQGSTIVEPLKTIGPNCCMICRISPWSRSTYNNPPPLDTTGNGLIGRGGLNSGCFVPISPQLSDDGEVELEGDKDDEFGDEVNSDKDKEDENM